MEYESLYGKFKYARFFIDEHSRFVIVEFLKNKSEVIDATKRAIAKFNASSVGVPVNGNGKPLFCGLGFAGYTAIMRGSSILHCLRCSVPTLRFTLLLVLHTIIISIQLL